MCARVVCFCAVLLSISGNAMAGGAAAQRASMTEPAYRALPNLVANASFEMDWMHNRVTANTRFMLLEQSDWGYAQSDGRPDYWLVSDASRLDAETAKFGKHSLRLQGVASQVIYLLGETDPRDGGAHYNAFRPLAGNLLKHIQPRPLRFAAWCKTEGAKAAPTLSVTMEYADKKTRHHSVTFGMGTHAWEYQEIVIPSSDIKEVPHAAVLRLAFQGAGAAWFDGILGEETVGAGEVDLLQNGDFKRLNNNWPAGWSAPELWSFSRREYYRFTGWSHGKGKMAGGATVAPLGRNGGQALQFTLLPGDNVAVKSQPIRLNQKEARALEVSAWIKAQDLRWLEIMAQDEKGDWLPQQDLAGCMGTDEHYRNRVAGIGSHDYEFVRLHFAPAKPVQEMTLWLCARGFDGKQMNRNVVGTVWFDDVSLRERGTPQDELLKRGVAVPRRASPTPSELPYRILSLDMGERLWGMNELKMIVENPSDVPIEVPRILTLTGPMKAGSVIEPSSRIHLNPAKVPAKGQAEVVIPYELKTLARDWQEHFRMAGPWNLSFGTPPAPISLRLGGTYIFPGEKLDVGVNFHIAQASLKEVGKCRVIVRHPKGEKLILDTDNPLGRSPSPVSPLPGGDGAPLLKEGHVDAKNLLALSISAEGFTFHKHSEPVRDCRIVVTLTDRQGKVIAQETSEPFGFLAAPAGTGLPERIEKTEVIEGGTLLVNGKPYIFNCFPLGKTDLGSVSRLLNFPASHKILALPYPKQLVFGREDEAGWKQKIQTFVRSAKDDPKLLGYTFGHDGETTFWFEGWKDLAKCQRKAAQWVREVDPNHVILSASWLFGHGALTPETAAHFGFFDVIDVEPGLTWTPDSHAVRSAAGRPVAVIAGLEAYYYQSAALLRWRMYEALRQGANGIGICPSGMLHARPELISFLRGLHGEVEGLQPMMTGQAILVPRLAKSDSPEVTLWERQHENTRYIVAMLGGRLPDGKRQRVSFAIPQGAGRVEVMFEGRTIAMEKGGFSDVFDEPYAVHVYRLSSGGQ